MFDERIVFKGQIGEEGATDFNAVAFGNFQPISVLFAVASSATPVPESGYDVETSILRSRDSGRTWEVSYVPQPLHTAGSTAIPFANSLGVGSIRVGYDRDPEDRTIWQSVCTEDGGINWFRCDEQIPSIGLGSSLSTGASFLYNLGQEIYISDEHRSNWSVAFNIDSNRYLGYARVLGGGEVYQQFVDRNSELICGGICNCNEILCAGNNYPVGEFKSQNYGYTWEEYRTTIPKYELRRAGFYPQGMVDIQRNLIYLRPPLRQVNTNEIIGISFTDDGGKTEFGEITTQSFTTHEPSYFREAAYLGEGRLVLRLTEVYSGEYHRYGDRILLSEDYGLSWQNVNYLNVKSETG